jgi:hypothetical protein
MLRLVQLSDGHERKVALVDEPHLRLLPTYDSAYALATTAITQGRSLSSLVQECATGPALDYDAIYHGRDRWRLRAPFDHPTEPARCLVSGTGLTHLGSAKNRQAMHGVSEAEMTDSMRMFRQGLEGGRPAEGCIGVAPEWFYKGTGDILQAPGEPLWVPAFGEDGGEEAEIAGVYLVGPDGTPWRVGLAAGNEFSDHRFETTNYLNLASSKMRHCAIGPELVIGAPEADLQSVPGVVRIERAGDVVWEKAIASGEAEMCHSLANIEHHHFKFPGHRRSGDAHVHYFGAYSLSFGDGVALADGDVMVVRFDGFGRALRNPIRIAPKGDRPIRARVLA